MLTAEQNSALAELSDALRPIAAAIEATAVAATQHNYGEYMAAIARITTRTGLSPIVVAVGLVDAGASRPGVLAALRAMGHI